jgi:ribosome maturation factor RimP
VIRTDEELFQLTAGVVGEMGYTLVGVEDVAEHGRRIFRFTIDQPLGVRVRDCERVSRELSDLLDAEFAFDAQYCLEVSSPGLDHVLKTEREYAHFVGRSARLVLREQIGGTNVIVGTLAGVLAGDLTITTEDGEEITISLSAVASARLVP